MIGQSVAPSQPYRPRVLSPVDAEAAVALVDLSRATSEEACHQAPMPDHLKGLRTLIDSQPPFVGQFGKRPSLPFLIGILSALQRVPQVLRQGVSEWGYKIVTATRIPDILPWSELQSMQTLRGKIIPNQEKSKGAVLAAIRDTNWWTTSTSNHALNPKTIFMPEVGTRPEAEFEPLSAHPNFLWLKQVKLSPVVPTSREYTMLHEFGHAVDDYMGNFPLKPEYSALRLSTTNAFKDAYFADVKTIQDPSVKQKLAYYLPRPYDPEDTGLRARAEAFADAFASVLMLNRKDQIAADVVEQRQFFSKHFPKTCEFVSSEVVQPYQELEDDEGLGEPADGDLGNLRKRKNSFDADGNEELFSFQPSSKKRAE